ncbi:hypothetical protein [Singulisphaera sp. PoT]|uniref:hypothetical protein n=1 Tax=Singulisphaera sp. PoT TaxID=3411797 RepID=UPI003BF4AC40
MHSQGLYGSVRYGLPGLLLGLALMGVFGAVRGPVARAQADLTRGQAGDRSRPIPTPVGESSNTLAIVSAAGGGPSQLLYLIDTKTKAFSVYRVDPMQGDRTVKLIGARQYQWDMKLSQFNNQEPEVAAVESMVKSASHPNR